MQIKERNNEVHLCWSGGYTGIKHNEEVNGLAKKAAIIST